MRIDRFWRLILRDEQVGHIKGALYVRGAYLLACEEQIDRDRIIRKIGIVEAEREHLILLCPLPARFRILAQACRELVGMIGKHGHHHIPTRKRNERKRLVLCLTKLIGAHGGLERTVVHGAFREGCGTNIIIEMDIGRDDRERPSIGKRIEAFLERTVEDIQVTCHQAHAIGRVSHHATLRGLCHSEALKRRFHIRAIRNRKIDEARQAYPPCLSTSDLDSTRIDIASHDAWHTGKTCFKTRIRFSEQAREHFRIELPPTRKAPVIAQDTRCHIGCHHGAFDNERATTTERIDKNTILRLERTSP